jgi:hypothetical protein
MPTTNQFFLWFYYGLNGLGGWFLFFILGLAGVVYVLYDSNRRRLPAIGWRLGVILTWLLIIPAMIYRFTVDPLSVDPTQPLSQLGEPIFYLGLLGGILPPVIAAGYFVTYQGLKGCVNGHVYESALGDCPECARLATPIPAPVTSLPAMPISSAGQPPPQVPVKPPKPTAHAWLVAKDGHNYQLYIGETTLGRSAQNDIQFTGDNTVSRQHAKIVEQNGHFRLVDLGADNHTRVNDQIIRQPVMLDHGDEIQLGDNTHLRFVKGS